MTCADQPEVRETTKIGEHRVGTPNVIGDRLYLVPDWEHLFFPPHHLLDPFGDVKSFVSRQLREAPGDFLITLLRGSPVVYGVAEADDDLCLQPSPYVGFGLAGIL